MPQIQNGELGQDVRTKINESIAKTDMITVTGAVNLDTLGATYAALSHSHAASHIASGTFNDARIAQTNVTQHQAALSITESQISDLGAYLLEEDLDGLQVEPLEGPFVDGDKTKLNGVAVGAQVNTINSNPAGIPGADQITNVVSLTQVEYDAIVTPDPSTFYVVTA